MRSTRRLMAFSLSALMLLGLLSGCKKNQPEASPSPSVQPSAQPSAPNNVTPAGGFNVNGTDPEPSKSTAVPSNSPAPVQTAEYGGIPLNNIVTEVVILASAGPAVDTSALGNIDIATIKSQAGDIARAGKYTDDEIIRWLDQVLLRVSEQDYQTATQEQIDDARNMISVITASITNKVYDQATLEAFLGEHGLPIYNRWRAKLAAQNQNNGQGGTSGPSDPQNPGYDPGFGGNQTVQPGNPTGNNGTGSPSGPNDPTGGQTGSNPQHSQQPDPNGGNSGTITWTEPSPSGQPGSNTTPAQQPSRNPGGQTVTPPSTTPPHTEGSDVPTAQFSVTESIADHHLESETGDVSVNITISCPDLAGTTKNPIAVFLHYDDNGRVVKYSYFNTPYNMDRTAGTYKYVMSFNNYTGDTPVTRHVYLFRVPDGYFIGDWNDIKQSQCVRVY